MCRMSTIAYQTKVLNFYILNSYILYQFGLLASLDRYSTESRQVIPPCNTFINRMNMCLFLYLTDLDAWEKTQLIEFYFVAQQARFVATRPRQLTPSAI